MDEPSVVEKWNTAKGSASRYSVGTTTSGSKSQDRKKTTRTAMGEFVVPVGGKPLTSLGDCLPAPSDYSPKVDLTKPAAPQYSVAGPYKASRTDYDVSPADHDTTPNLTWRDRKISLKGKGKMRPYDVRDDFQINDSVGPLQYRVEYNKTGDSGPKWSITMPHDPVDDGPPNRLVQPVDTHGTDTPGPNYRPNSGFWKRGREISFGSSRKVKPPEGPGPAEYSIRDVDTGLCKSLAKRLPPSLLWKNSINTISPGPGSYELGTTIGKAMAKSIGGRPEEIYIEQGPAPNLYTLPDSFNKDLHAATLNYGWQTMDPDAEDSPGPTTYTTYNKCISLKKAPIYTMSNQTRPCFPDILNYPLLAQQQTTYPGPGSYENHGKPKDKKKFSMGMRARSVKNEVPGPNRYSINSDHKPKFDTPPSFSMGRRVAAMNRHISPGPAAYNPRPDSNNSGYSMTQRPKQTKKFVTPAPNAYALRHCQTAKGTNKGPAATLKSRASPYAHSGLQTGKVLNEVECK